MCGLDMTRDMPKIRRTLGVCAQDDRLEPTLSVYRHLKLYAAFKGVEPADVAVDSVIAKVGLTEKRDVAASQLSGGMKRKLGLAIALTNTVSIDWFGMFLAWLVKVVALRYGGIHLYRLLLPFFIGLILGTCVGIGGASLVYAFYYY